MRLGAILSPSAQLAAGSPMLVRKILIGHYRRCLVSRAVLYSDRSDAEGDVCSRANSPALFILAASSVSRIDEAFALNEQSRLPTRVTRADEVSANALAVPARQDRHL